ncbi:hypothetical protein DL93DRAFT_2124439 [Clavulina sp. PMI_390]|nr:hypothetical protein DL93DRAFT_2124439 [Clavulina sp. PMI_390]
MDRSLSIVVAAARNNGIGAASRLPWRLPAEMAYFVKITSEAPAGKMNALVMGRKSWESIPPKFRPLKNRLNVVISSNKDYDLGPNAGPTILASSLPDALACLSLSPSTPSPDETPPTFPTLHRTFIIGGATIYTEALHTLTSSPLSGFTLDRILITRISEPAFDECDVFFPEFRPPERDQLTPADIVSSSELASEAAKADNASPFGVWRRVTHDELTHWAGFDVPKDTNEEKGVKYEFQMWERVSKSSPS